MLGTVGTKVLTNSGVVTMARARRAKPRRSRALIGLIVVALLAGGVVAALRFWPSSLTAIGPNTSPAAVSTPSAAVPSSPTPSAPAERTATATPAGAEVVEAMEACQKRVRAADEVLSEARTGIGHWETHVGAQRDADDGKISAEERKRIFKETRLKGPGDQKRY